MSIQEKLYLIMVNKRNERCIFLTPENISKLTVTTPEIIYDGKEHAILYRNNKESILLDYIPESQREELTKLSEILVVEYDVNKKEIANEYMAKMTIVKKIPNISKDLVEKVKV